MKNDLTKFEKDLLKAINMMNNTKYDHNHLMEWSSSIEVVKKNLKPGEKLYKVMGVNVAIKTDG